MSVYEYLNLINDLSCVIVTIYDLTSGKEVYNSTKSEDGECTPFDVDDKGFGDYEVLSVDIFKDKDGHLCLELNIETEDEE